MRDLHRSFEDLAPEFLNLFSIGVNVIDRDVSHKMRWRNRPFSEPFRISLIQPSDRMVAARRKLMISRAVFGGSAILKDPTEDRLIKRFAFLGIARAYGDLGPDKSTLLRFWKTGHFTSLFCHRSSPLRKNKVSPLEIV